MMPPPQIARLLPRAVLALVLAKIGTTATVHMTNHALNLTPVKPELVGFSSERLDRLHTLIQQEIDHKELVGAVTLLARHGKIVDYRTYGLRDLAAGAP
jgi:CubicO group peptidase (beta-lactamase class C family)